MNSRPITSCDAPAGIVSEKRIRDEQLQPGFKSCNSKALRNHGVCQEAWTSKDKLLPILIKT